jgi:iron complex outermembrane receptor protein
MQQPFASRILGSGILCAIAASLALTPEPVQAQEERQVDAIEVTASRITGFAAPTPTTIVGVEDLQATAAPTIADVLNRLPSFSGAGPTAQGVATANPGANYLNLRGVGASRTLVLLDGRRHVPTSDQGTVDVNVIPSALIQRTDVVTGGASAAYGSDAVAGVVNFILDTDFNGFRGLLQGGVTQRGDDKTFRTSLAWGQDFLDGRARVMIAGEYSRTSDAPYYRDRDWAQNYQVLTNTAPGAGVTAPLRIVAPNVTYSSMTFGGLIQNGPLRGVQFLPGGIPAAFVPGTLVGTNFMLGGGGDTLTQDVVLDVPSTRGNLFARLDYQVTPAVSASLEVSHAESETMATTVAPFDASMVIRSDNAYLPTSLRAALTGVPTFSLGRLNRDLGMIGNGGDTQTDRIAAAVKGEFGQGWNWDAYVQWGQTDYLQSQPNNRNNLLWQQAIDAMAGPGGTIVCRNPAGGCLPLNIFGAGSMDPAALARVKGTAWFRSLITQWAGAANISGEPVSLWAGPVAVAAGLEFRKESLKTTSDPGSRARTWRIGNFQPLSGEYDVREAYAEIGAPLLKDAAFARDLSLNAAARYTDYSLSGGVRTWKLGAVWAVNDQIQFRVTRSRDIRAPNLGELYQAGNQLSSGITDRLNGNLQYTAPSFTGGSPKLEPERATTEAFGVVLNPSVLSGLRLSVDYYDITIDGAIGSLGAQATIDRCFQGATAICANITRSPTTGLITRIDGAFMNIASRRQRGYDMEAAYRVPMADLFDRWQGDLNLRILATYLKVNNTNDGVVTLRTAGQATGQGQPKLKINAKLTYANGPLTLYAEERFVDSTVYDNSFTALDIDRNKIPSAHYTTVSASYDVVSEVDLTLTAFLVIDNLFDRDPEIVASTGFASQTNAAIFDVLGRRFTAGMRFDF